MTRRRRSPVRTQVNALLSERYGPTTDLIREAVAKPPPRPATSEAAAAAHRRQLLDAMPIGGGPYGRAQKRREPGSLPQSRAAVPSLSRTTTDDEGGRVSSLDQATVRPGTDKTGEVGR